MEISDLFSELLMHLINYWLFNWYLKRKIVILRKKKNFSYSHNGKIPEAKTSQIQD